MKEKIKMSKCTVVRHRDGVIGKMKYEYRVIRCHDGFRKSCYDLVT